MLHFFFFLLLRKCLPNTKIWVTIVCLLIVLSRKIQSNEESGYFISQLNHKSIFETIILRQEPKTYFMCTSHFIIQNIKKTGAHKSTSNKNNKFYCFNDTHEASMHANVCVRVCVFRCKYVMMKTWRLVSFGETALIQSKMPAVPFVTAFVLLVQISIWTSWKGLRGYTFWEDVF